MGIKEIMEAVLKTVDSNNERLLIYNDGSISRRTSIVNPPAEEVAIAEYESHIGQRLPKDYRSFLLEYNGAWIYQYITDLGGNGGGGLQVFSVKELIENMYYMDVYPRFCQLGACMTTTWPSVSTRLRIKTPITFTELITMTALKL